PCARRPPGAGSPARDASGRGVDGVERTMGDALDWLHGHARMPFFLFIHTYQVHWPYQSPPPYRGMFADPARSGTASELDASDAAIRYTDTTLASLVAALDELGLARRTILIVICRPRRGVQRARHRPARQRDVRGGAARAVHLARAGVDRGGAAHPD